MTDYFAVFLYGFSTGMGVVIAQETWQFIKKYRIHKLPMDMAEDIVNDIKNKGVRRR
jgi:hypothetical protein